MIEFHAEDWFSITGRGRVAMVRCDKERPRTGTGLEKEIVSIDGVRFRVVAVERNLIIPPIQQGESIGLLVEDPLEPYSSPWHARDQEFKPRAETLAKKHGMHCIAIGPGGAHMKHERGEFVMGLDGGYFDNYNDMIFFLKRNRIEP